MLVLARKKEEAVVIGDGVRVVVLGVHNGQVKLGFEASREINIVREEVKERVKNEQAA